MRFVRLAQANTNRPVWINPAEVTAFTGKQITMIGQPEPIREETQITLTSGGTFTVLGKPEHILVLLDGEA
jgi:hypothetical protein